MNHYTWVRCKNHLALDNGSSLLHPSAAEVYSVLQGEDAGVNGLECSPIQEDIPELRLSIIGSELRCDLILDDSTGDINLLLYTDRMGDKVDVDMLQGEIIDQCIHNNEWFFLTGRIEEIKEILKKAGVSRTGIIPISTYMLILQETWMRNDSPVLNLVNPEKLGSDIQTQTVPEELHADLYDYQRIGYSWMHYMLSEYSGCILGDEMGLGKTLQIITLFQKYKNAARTPLLVVAPVSLLQNWKRECEKFAPTLRVLLHHGSDRTGRYREFLDYDVVVTSYTLVSADISILSMVRWEIVVLDEAQNIKNPSSNRAVFVKRIPRQKSIAVTGTPFENHITDIWSLVDFVSPGLLGDLSEYTRLFSDDISGGQQVERILSPLMIRRLVRDVANDLPEKVIIPVPLNMSESEARSYEEYRSDLVETGSPDIAMLGKLRQFCTHPMVCNESTTGDPCESSVKYQRFCEILEEIISCGEKVLVFTSFIRMFDIMEQDLTVRFSIPVFRINGETPIEERQPIIDNFNSLIGSSVLILNPRAAGTGLNITGANHVIHFNLEWNPALEDQSSARSYRRGQTKTVFIYRLYYEDTVEQIVNERTERKRDIAENAVVGTSGEHANREDIMRALELSPFHKKGI